MLSWFHSHRLDHRKNRFAVATMMILFVGHSSSHRGISITSTHILCL
uniref:Uncharacterized protein n=1 Tax=Anguilla anguilla TaxID=7936 RepID=A0A0E9TPJ1_ANGAN